MNFKEFLKEDDKFKAFKSFIDKREVEKISNDFTKDDVTKLLRQTYPDVANIYAKVASIHVTYDELVKAFGMPPKLIYYSTESSNEYKWLIWFKDGILASVTVHIFPEAGEEIENTKHWVVQARDAEDCTARIKSYIISKGGKLLKESNKLVGLKSFVTSQQILDARSKAPFIQTVEELERLPDKSIIWYPEHSEQIGTCITKDILLDYIKYQKETHGSPMRQAWDVYLNGKHIDTVFFSSNGMMHYKDVLDSLIHHDGYDPDIEISTKPNITPELENKIRDFARDFGVLTETKEDELMPAVSITEDPMYFETDEDKEDINQYPEEYINFITKAIQKGYKFYQVPYERKFEANNIRHWWRLLD